jgi:hypothetical protein
MYEYTKTKKIKGVRMYTEELQEYEVIQLPSMGKVYPKDNLLSSG